MSVRDVDRWCRFAQPPATGCDASGVEHLQLIEERSTLLQRLTVRQRRGVMAFRYWQEGPGYDRNSKQARSVVAAIDYVHMNPVRRGLCERCTDW